MGKPEDVIRHIFRLTAEASAFRHSAPLEILAFREISEVEAREQRRKESAADAEKLLEQLLSVEERLKAMSEDISTLRNENNTLKQNLEALMGVQALAPTFEEDNTSVDDEDDDEPTNVLDAVKKGGQKCRNLTFLPTAHASASESPYRHPARVLEALLAIDEVGGLWIKGLSTGISPGPLKQLFKQRGFDYKDDISQTSKGKWGEEYQANYEGKIIDVSPHITIGAKQADTCLSIHMNWDKDSKLILIAHVGRHKTNTKT